MAKRKQVTSTVEIGAYAQDSLPPPRFRAACLGRACIRWSGEPCKAYTVLVATDEEGNEASYAIKGYVCTANEGNIILGLETDIFSADVDPQIVALRAAQTRLRPR